MAPIMSMSGRLATIHPPTPDTPTEVSPTEFLAAIGFVIFIFICFIIFIAFRHAREHDYPDTEYIHSEQVTHAQLAALRQWAENSITSLTQKHEEEMRAQQEWAQNLVTGQLGEHQGVLGVPSQGYGTMESTAVAGPSTQIGLDHANTFLVY